MPWGYRKRKGPFRFSASRRGVRAGIGCLVYALGAAALTSFAIALLIVLL